MIGEWAFDVQEISLLRRSEIASSCSQDKFEQDFTDKLMAACILDPSDGQPVADTWSDKGCQFSLLMDAVLEVNGLKQDQVEEKVKG